MSKPANLTLGKMVILGVGWFGILFFWGFYSGSMPLFLSKFTDSKLTISLVLSLAGLSGCTVPPIVGYFSDRTRTRFGRRKPYIFLGMLSTSICMLGLPYVTAFGVVLLLSTAMYFSIDIAQTPYMSLLPDLTPPQQRSTASGVMNFFGSVGLIACFFLTSRIWDERPTWAFCLVAIVSFGAVLISIVLVREREITRIERVEVASPLSYLKGIAKASNALKFFIAQFFWWLGFWVIQSFITLFVAEELKVAAGKSLLVPMASSLMQLLFVFPLGIMGDRFGRKSILLCMIAFWAVAQVSIGFSRSLTHALITVGVTGIPIAAVMSVGYAYMLDLIPSERTAEFVGIGVISMAAPQIFGPLIGGELIDALGYRSIFPAGALFMTVAFIMLRLVRPGDEKQFCQSKNVSRDSDGREV